MKPNEGGDPIDSMDSDSSMRRAAPQKRDERTSSPVTTSVSPEPQLDQSELTLQIEQSRLLDFYHHAPVGHLTLDQAGLVLHANPRAATMLSVPDDTLLGQSFHHFLGPDNADQYSRLQRRLVESGPAQSATVRIARAYGAATLRLEASLVRERDGSQHCRIMLSDISARWAAEKAQQRSEERFQQIVETAEEGIITIDCESQVDFVNPKMARMIGYTANEMLGRPLADFLDEEGRRRLNYYLQRRRQGIAEQFEFKFVRNDGSDLWVYTSTNPLTDGSGAYIGALAMFTDLTERRQQQKLLAWEKSCLEVIADDTSMSEALDKIVLGLEPLVGGICSILLLDKGGLHLHHGAAPNLPEAYNRFVDGLAIGPTVGSCGTAAYSRRQVVVADTSCDSLWANFRSMALEYELRACWSTPIQEGQGPILGTFAMYFREPRSPDPWEQETIDRAVRIAYLAIERKQAEEKLRVLNQELEDRVAARTVQLRALACQLTQTEERERLRTADILHEGLLQTLAAVAMGLDGLGMSLPEGAPLDCLQNLRHRLREAIELGRTLTYEIYPPALQFQDFGHALKSLSQRHQEQHGLEVTVQAPSGFELKEKELRVFLFRAANELLTNVYRHARIGQAYLSLSLEPDRAVRMIVSDSGQGLDPLAVRSREGLKGGFGLFSLRERVEALGGSLEVHGTPGSGTRVTVTVPQDV